MDYHKDTKVYFIYGLFYSSAQIQTVNVHTWESLKILNSAKMITFWQNKMNRFLQMLTLLLSNTVFISNNVH